MYQKRLFALHTSKIYTRLSAEVYHPNYQDWLKILENEANLIHNKISENLVSSRLTKNRDDNYQKWLQKSSGFPLDGQSYNWVSYQVQPGDTLEKIALKTLGRDDFDYCDLIAIRNNLTSEILLIDDAIEIPQLIGNSQA